MRAPRLVTRTLVSSFLTVALVLGAVFAMLSLRVREQVRQSVADNLASAQQVFTRVEARRQQDVRAAVATLAENPTLKAALDVWLSERVSANARSSSELLATVQRESDKMAERVAADVLAVSDAAGRIVASSGRLAASWRRGVIVEGRISATAATDRSAGVGSGVYHVISVPLQHGEATIGSLDLGTALDVGYACQLADLSRGHAAIVRGPVVLASTLSGPAARDLARSGGDAVGAARTLTLAGESWAVQPLLQPGDVTFLALASIDAAAAGQTTAALRSLGMGRRGRHRPGGDWQRLAGADVDQPGLGYPYGLRGNEIPQLARIVHVADAFDAMTSARAYRSGRIPVEAITELRMCIGTDFDGASVEALVAASERVDPVVHQWVSHRARSA